MAKIILVVRISISKICFIITVKFTNYEIQQQSDIPCLVHNVQQHRHSAGRQSLTNPEIRQKGRYSQTMKTSLSLVKYTINLVLQIRLFLYL